jgi:hypothetical protein
MTNTYFGLRIAFSANSLNHPYAFLKSIKLQFPIFLILISSFYSDSMACGFDFVGDCGSFTKWQVGSNNQEYFIAGCPYGNQFPSSLGSGLTNLKLTYAETRTWQSCTNNVLESAIYYRVYADPLNKGAFLKVGLTQVTLFSSPPYTTKTYFDTFSSDLLTGLGNNTNYTVEVYFELKVDTDNNGSGDATLIRNNSGNFYKSTFSTGTIVTQAGFPVNITKTNATCSNLSNGSASATPTGGVAPYTYKWSNNATTASISNLGVGSYSITVTDANGATGIKSTSISAPAAVVATITTVNPSCAQSNGTANVSASGGNPPFSYLWNNNSTVSSRSNLPIGNISVTVTDANQCTGTASATLTENCGGGGNYCSSAAAAPWNEWIARLKFNTIDNVSGKIRQDKFAVGYSDFKDQNTTLTAGNSYPVTITPGLSWAGQIDNLFYRVWIDYNKNSLFDSNEMVFEANTISQPASGTILVPATALPGNTVMRVTMKKDGYPTSCEAFPAGEVEDYTIIMAAGTVDCATDNVPPVFLTCPSNQSLTILSPATTGIATWVTPTVSDNCTLNPTLTLNFASGSNFPIGTTNVVYTAKDIKNNTSTCGFTINVTQVNPDACKKFTLSNTNDICGGTWKPYGLQIFSGTTTQFLHADAVTVEKTASDVKISGTFRTSTWAPVLVNITLTGPTTIAPSGSPLNPLCGSASQVGWTYYPNLTGTITIGGTALTVTRRGPSFQYGIGANRQNNSTLGMFGGISLSDGSTGDFSFQLSNEVPCANPLVDPLETRSLLSTFDLEPGLNSVDLTWSTYSDKIIDHFQVLKADQKGNFKVLDKLSYDSKSKFYYSDHNLVEEADNVYQIATIHKDGSSYLSEVRAIQIGKLSSSTVFPNPTQGEFNLYLQNYEKTGAQVTIFNSFGDQIFNTQLNKNFGEYVSLNIGDHPNGLYLVRIYVDTKPEQVLKIILNK